MSDSRVANRYAKSLIELAVDKKVLDLVAADLQSFARICEANRDFLLMLRNPIIRHDKKLAIFKQSFTGKFQPLTLSFFEIITRKNREAVLYHIAKQFEEQYNVLRQIDVAEVITAVALNTTLRGEILESLAKITGKSVVLTEKIDPELIGGYLLRVNDIQIDNTISSKLNKLKIKFSQNPYISKL
jgi:F-type H+-transporting ATPase subunit delta